MSDCPSVEEVKAALAAEAAGYECRIRQLREQLREEGKDAVDPGHCGAANDLRLNIACVEELLALLPQPDSARRTIVCIDPDSSEPEVYAVVAGGRGGIRLRVDEHTVLTLSNTAPAAIELLSCRVGDVSSSGLVVAVAEK